MRKLFERLGGELAEREKSGHLRSLRQYCGEDFGSNDYLGFARDVPLKARSLDQASLALSSSGSRLLPGNHAMHREAEERFARFVGAESALLFNSGYDANTALLTSLPTRHDVILYDERSHASIYDGARASTAQSYKFRHNSVADLSERIDRIRADRPTATLFVVAESVYSMDGDEAPLRELAQVAAEAGAVLIIDEAHATGVLGDRGEGGVTSSLTRTPDIITVHTCGKALGAAGAFVAARTTITDYLVNTARQFIFTTALPPAIPFQICNSITLLEEQGAELTNRLLVRSAEVRRALHARLRSWSIPAGRTPIIPIIIGNASNALEASRQLAERGFDVPAVRPPSVPEGSSRLRLNISLRHTDELLRNVVDAILEVETDMTT